MTTRLDAVRAAAGNTPRRTVNKKAILPGPAQGRKFATGVLLPNAVDHCTVAEGHTTELEAIDDLPRWAATKARPNDRFPHTSIRNAVVTNVSGQGWRRMDRVNINFPWSEKPDGLNAVASLAVRRSDGFQMATVAFHFPHAGAAPQSVWDRMAGQLALYISRIDCPVMLGADFNRGMRVVQRAFTDLELAASADVMGVLTRGFKVTGSEVITAGYVPKVSDHSGLPVATLRPVDTRRIKRLPR